MLKTICHNQKKKLALIDWGKLTCKRRNTIVILFITIREEAATLAVDVYVSYQSIFIRLPTVFIPSVHMLENNFDVNPAMGMRLSAGEHNVRSRS